MAKVVVLLSPTQRTKLLQIPDNFSEREITRYYSLSTEDLAAIEQHRRPKNRLGFTVQLAYLRFPGRPWDPQEQVPPAVLTYLAEQIGEAPDVLVDYASRDPTRREHLYEIQRVFQFHPFTMQTYRDLSRWLMPIALSTDQGIARTPCASACCLDPGTAWLVRSQLDSTIALPHGRILLWEERMPHE